MKVLIDTDPGKDDVIAIAMVLQRKDVEIVGITSVVGNTSVDKTTINVLKLLHTYERTDIPVFKGASTPIINCTHDGEYYHGTDGLGDVHHFEPDMSPLQQEHAVQAINRICKQHSGEITVIALGPLTNLALAIRLDESLPTHIKDLVIMGGNHKGVGNITMAAEFNFFMDPTAAHMVLEEFTCPKYLVTWELSGETILTEEDILEYCGRDNPRSQFMKKIIKPVKQGKNTESGYCDSVAVAIATNRELILKKHEVYATVEMHGAFTKGSVVIDWNPQFRQVGDRKQNNVIIADKIDEELYRKLFLQATE